jgi:hypothetical protein
LKDYNGSLECCLRWIELNKARPKPIHHIEVNITAAQCAAHLGKNDLALTLLTAVEPSVDPDFVFLKGKILRLNQRCTESLQAFKQYIEIRGNDYTALKELAYLFESHQHCIHGSPAVASCSGLTLGIENEERGSWHNRCLGLAIESMQRAQWLATRSGRPSTVIAKRNEQVELTHMAAFIEQQKLQMATALEDVSGFQNFSLGFDEETTAWIKSIIPTEGQVDHLPDIDESQRSVRAM